MHDRLSRPTLLIALSGAMCVSACGAMGCTWELNVGTRGRFTPRIDECGNGIDDDRNGRIDDGCVCGQGEMQSCFSGDYPSHGVGACRDGVQRCDVQEFGDWGDFPCTGEILPSAERCDELDNDCDGSRDESCTCESGATRPCGELFRIAPCTPGMQTCRMGVWSACEGTISPTADVCSDAIDNDCDGLVNEGCACNSVAEICGDSVDNDCDGETDELACAATEDGGIRDAGVDASTRGSIDLRPTLDDASAWTQHAYVPAPGCVLTATYEASGGNPGDRLCLDLHGCPATGSSFAEFVAWNAQELLESRDGRICRVDASMEVSALSPSATRLQARIGMQGAQASNPTGTTGQWFPVYASSPAWESGRTSIDRAGLVDSGIDMTRPIYFTIAIIVDRWSTTPDQVVCVDNPTFHVAFDLDGDDVCDTP